MRPPNRGKPVLSKLVASLLSWFDNNARDLPWRRTTDPYAIWISEIMLQQTQVKTVIAYWTRWMKTFPDARALAQAPPQEVLKLWEGLGYYARVRNAQAAAQVIVQKFGGQFPPAFDDVLALPGVGRYTAGAVCSIAFNQPRPIVDGNVSRVLSRIFGIGSDPREKAASAQLWKLAEELVTVAHSHSTPQSSTVRRAVPCPPNGVSTAPAPLPHVGQPIPNAIHPPSIRNAPGQTTAATHRTSSAFNQSLMELGALVCTPLQPRCAACPAQNSCFAFNAGKVEQFPARRPSPRLTPRRFIAFIVQKKNRFLTRQRPAGGVNAHFWEFPNIEIVDAATNLATLILPFALEESSPFCRVKHSITRYRIQLNAYRAQLPEENLKTRALGVWRTAAQLRRMPLTSAHRRILDRLISKIPADPTLNPKPARCIVGGHVKRTIVETGIARRQEDQERKSPRNL